MNKQEIEKVINYMQNMDLSVFIDKDEACGVIDMVTKLLQQQLTNESEIKRLQDEVESLRNWNACEKEQYSDLLKSDKRRIELEEENEELRKQLTNGWIPVSERLPVNEERVLICANRKFQDGNTIQIIAVAMYENGTMHTEDSGFVWEDIDFEYCEETDDYIIPEGWWEQTMYCEEFGKVDDFVTHWQPLPPKYKEVSDD